MKTQTESTFQSVATELAQSFVSDKREDGTTFYKIKDDAPDWLGEISHKFHEAVDDRFPDDWIYEQAERLAGLIAEKDDADEARDCTGEWADSGVDVYNADLTKWLASHLANISLCDEAVEEIGVGNAGGIIGMIQSGQYMAIDRIAHALINAIESELESRN